MIPSLHNLSCQQASVGAPTEKAVAKMASEPWAQTSLDEFAKTNRFKRVSMFVIASAGKSKKNALDAHANAWTKFTKTIELSDNKGFKYVIFQIFEENSDLDTFVKNKEDGIALVKDFDRRGILWGFLGKDYSGMRKWRIVRGEWQDILSE